MVVTRRALAASGCRQVKLKCEHARSPGRRSNHGSDAFRQTLNAVLYFCRRERAEWEPEEPLSAAVWEEREAIGEIEAPGGRLFADLARMHTLGQRDRDEEASIRTRRAGLWHVPVEPRKARIQARRIQLLQALDLRRQKSSPAPFGCDSLRDIARRDVRILGRLGEVLEERRFADHESSADAGSYELGKRTHMHRAC